LIGVYLENHNMKKIFILILLLPLFCESQTYTRVDHAGTLWFVNTNGLDSVSLAAADLSGMSMLYNSLLNKQAALVSGTNIKTINSTSLLGSGDIAISGSGTTLNGTGFVKAAGTVISYDNSTYLSSIDTTNISTFSAKVRSLFAGTSPITYNNGSFGINQATTTTNGYLSSTDWNTFNGKQPAGSYLTSYTETDPIVKAINGIVKSNGITISAAVAGTDYALPNANTTGTAANITAATNGTLTTLSILSLPYSQLSGTPTISGGKGMSVTSPTSTENIMMYFTPIVITVTNVQEALSGSTPSVTYILGYSSTRSGVLTNIVDSHAATSTTGVAATLTANVSIPANSYIILTTSATSGTINELGIAINYHQ